MRLLWIAHRARRAMGSAEDLRARPQWPRTSLSPLSRRPLRRAGSELLGKTSRGTGNCPDDCASGLSSGDRRGSRPVKDRHSILTFDLLQGTVPTVFVQLGGVALRSCKTHRRASNRICSARNAQSTGLSRPSRSTGYVSVVLIRRDFGVVVRSQMARCFPTCLTRACCRSSTVVACCVQSCRPSWRDGRVVLFGPKPDNQS
jgi:hypothetical protein